MISEVYQSRLTLPHYFLDAIWTYLFAKLSTYKYLLSDLGVSYESFLRRIMEPSSIDEAESAETEAQQMDMDNKVENTSSNITPNTHRERSNSVIDSFDFKRHLAVVASSNIRRRTKSVDYQIRSESYYMNNLYIPGTSRDEDPISTTNNEREGKQSSEMKKSDKIDATGTPYNESTKTKTSKLTASMPVLKDADCYNMNHKNRGKCIIFNHEEFSMSQTKREGTSKDVKRLQETFGKLGFDVEVYNNFIYYEIIDKLNKVSQLDHTDNDCLCVITLTHGNYRNALYAKDVMYDSKVLWKTFTADKCVTLAGKPKLFFIQACRGEETDDGIELISNYSLRGTETDSNLAYSIPIHADFLVAHSSVEGFYTWRNPYQGTWYIQCLCDILDEHGTTMDLMNMLTLTARKVATEFSSVNPEYITLHDKRQVPSVTTMLIRSVYFPPKLKE